MPLYKRTVLRLWMVLLILATAGLGCNLLNATSDQVVTSAPPTPVPAALPEVTILWPPTGSEFVVRDEITVHVHASDAAGITRLELRSPEMMLSSVSSPERSGQSVMDAILPWRPSRSGVQDLEVVAYRGRVSSTPVPLRLIIRSRAAEIVATPLPFGILQTPVEEPDGTACQVRVNINNLRFRTGPGTTYTILGLLDVGETLSVTGTNASRTWYRAVRNNQVVWLSANPGYITELSDCSDAPIVE
ncbi:MAG: hypothetical protein Kow0077_02730 [Anaerolineae bacterium]